MNSDDFSLLFPTIIMHRLDALPVETLVRLRSFAYWLETEVPSVKPRSNAGGYHSPDTLFSLYLDTPPWGMADTLNRLSRTVGEYLSILPTESQSAKAHWEGWINIHTRGGCHRPHTHPNRDISGVYYIDNGGDETGGEIEFIDPRLGRQHFKTYAIDEPTFIKIKPKTGMLLLFPAWMQHYTLPYLGDKKRITMAFNVTLQRS